jgi:hypothetical protein
MFDWPLQSQTSPTWTPVTVTLFVPDVTTIELGVELAVIGARLRIQSPVAFAVVDRLCV